MFRDVTTLFHNAQAWSAAIQELANKAKEFDVQSVAGIEARGFVVAAPLSIELDVGFVPIRKSGKLPAATFGREYELEYGRDRVEVHRDAFKSGQRVLVVDDLIATGGTALATIELIKETGATVAGTMFLIDLPELGGSRKIRESGIESFSLLTFPGH